MKTTTVRSRPNREKTCLRRGPLVSRGGAGGRGFDAKPMHCSGPVHWHLMQPVHIDCTAALAGTKSATYNQGPTQLDIFYYNQGPTQIDLCRLF